MRYLTSANVACGGHAGDTKSMAVCVRLARQYHVRLGAHPGAWDRANRRRGPIEISPDELELLLIHQVAALEKIARANAVKLHHIKLHGGLYHAAEESEALGRRYIAMARRWWRGVMIYARAGGRVARAGRSAGVMVWEEAFLDRNYREDGSLVPRTAPNALLGDIRAVAERLGDLIGDGAVRTTTGTRIRLIPQTLCIHSDTPNAVEFARVAAKLIKVRC